MTSEHLYPAVSIPELRAQYCFQVDSYRVLVSCNDGARCDRRLDYQFHDIEGGVINNPNETGEINPFSGSFYVINRDMRVQFPGWVASVNIQIWPKTELSMHSSHWRSEKDLVENTIRLHNRPAHKPEEWPNYTVPKDHNDVLIFRVEERLWSLCEFGDFSVNNALMTELTEHLALIIVFDTASFWQRKTYPPKDLKAHLKPVFIDYLSRIQIIPTEGVPESELPPLGFYPSKREEKEIDSEGNAVAEDIPASSSSEWGW